MSIRAGGEYLTASAAGLLLGLPIDSVRDVLKWQALRAAPLAPPAVAGLANLRGQVVTVIDLCAALGLTPSVDRTSATGIVVDVDGEPYGLLVDAVGDVIRPPASAFARSPSNLAANWREFCDGFYWREDGLLHVLNLASVLRQVAPATAA